MPTPTWRRPVLGAAALSRLGCDHRSRCARWHCLADHAEAGLQRGGAGWAPSVSGRRNDRWLARHLSDAIGVNNESEARKGVDRLVSAGAEFIKAYTRIDPPLLRAIVDEARAFNLRVTAHLGMTDAVTAAKAGIASIEHLTGVPEAASPNAKSLFGAHYRGFFPGWTAFERSWAGLDSAALTRVAKPAG